MGPEKENFTHQFDVTDVYQSHNCSFCQTKARAAPVALPSANSDRPLSSGKKGQIIPLNLLDTIQEKGSRVGCISC